MALLLVSLGPASAAPAPSTLLTVPRRAINGQTVDLTPLFNWWTNHQGDRPLSAWVRVSGTVVGSNAMGWVILGQAERPGAASTGISEYRFILKHPPAQELAEIERLRAELSLATAQRARIQAEEARVKREEALLHRVPRAPITVELRQVEQNDTRLTKTLDQTIGQLKKKLATYPNPDHYKIEAIALKAGAEYNHLPIYDYGLPAR